MTDAQNPQEFGDRPQNCGENADKGNDAAPSVVQAEIVRLPRPPRPLPPDNREAARQARAARRRDLLALFFTGHTPGRLTPKREAAYRLLDHVVDPVERETLHRLLQHLWDAAQSTSTEGL